MRILRVVKQRLSSLIVLMFRSYVFIILQLLPKSAFTTFFPIALFVPAVTTVSLSDLLLNTFSQNVGFFATFGGSAKFVKPAPTIS